MKAVNIMKKIGSGLITFILMVSLVFMVFVVITTKASGGEPEIFGYQLKTVLSGSMEPEFRTGSVIAVIPGGDMTRFQEGDIITFMERDSILITHRVMEVVHSGEHVMYRTKGDNNSAADSDMVLSENVVAQYTGFTIPYLGYLASFAQSKEGSTLLLIVPGILLLVYAGVTIWQAVSQLERNNRISNEVNPTEKVSEL